MEVLADKITSVLGLGGDPEAALQNAHARVEAAASSPRSIRATRIGKRDLHVSENRLGDQLRRMGKTAEAIEHYRTARANSDRLTKRDPKNAVWLSDLAVSEGRLADAMRDQGQLDAALEQARKALATTLRAAAAAPGDATRREWVSTAHRKIGDVLLAKKETAGATKNYRTAREVVEALAKEFPKNPRWPYMVSLTHQSLGDAEGARRHARSDRRIRGRFGSAPPASGEPTEPARLARLTHSAANSHGQRSCCERRSGKSDRGQSRSARRLHQARAAGTGFVRLERESRRRRNQPRRSSHGARRSA